ncbi:MAG TPA: hypothetical protein VFQ22_11490 [Longimicrobiales bacterium]|nr:hypothetical protein [Longimicrobiales bacterium]
MPTPVHYIPIVTTVVAALFAPAVLGRWRARRPAPHLFWWGLGIAVYGLGTLAESLTTLFGWSEPVFRSWYVTGALLGGAPLAQGTVYLMLPRRAAHLMGAAVGAVVLAGAVVVWLSPIDHALVEPHRLTGAVMTWRHARLFSPFVNTYAAIFLIGGAVASALRYRKDPASRHRFVGNGFIAVGALLPGIGGTFTRLGHTEVLYVTELVGLVLIWVGYRTVVGRAGRAEGATVAAARAQGG